MQAGTVITELFPFNQKKEEKRRKCYLPLTYLKLFENI